MPEGQTGATCESLWKRMIGKPYSGKLNVRFDEGELEIGLLATTPALYSTATFNECGGFSFYPLRCSQITLPLFLLF